MDPLQIGVFSFVNTLPLIRGLEKGIPGDYELLFSNPSTLADRLRYGELDAAEELHGWNQGGVGNGILPGLCIGSRGPMESIRFLSNEPPDQLRQEIRRLATRMTHGGGYILSCAKALQPETPAENAAAILEEFLAVEGGQ